MLEKGRTGCFSQLPELSSRFPYPHGCKDNGKVVFMIIQHSLGFLHQPGLAADLGCNLRQEGDHQGQSPVSGLLSVTEEDGPLETLDGDSPSPEE